MSEINLDKLFEEIDEMVYAPVQPGEFTVQDLLDRDDKGRTYQQFKRFANKMCKEGKWKKRTAVSVDGKTCNAYSIIK